MSSYWDSVGINYQFREREDMQIVADLIRTDDPESLIEFSVGSGMFPRMLRKTGWEGRYLGTDYVEHFLNNAKENNISEQFELMDLNEPLPVEDNEYEVSVIIHGLEYVADYKKTLSELKRITSKYIYLDLWVDFISGDDQVRFNDKGKWNVNLYNKEKFYRTLEELGLKVIFDTLNQNEFSKTNRILKLQV